MAEQKRLSADQTDKRNVGNGPYLARIINHLDPSLMGGLEVTLLRNQGNDMGDETQSYQVRCAMPFFGYTAYEYMGQNSSTNPDDPKKPPPTIEAYNDTQKSYGMWFVPPDVGVTVIVVFIDGDPAQGYWIGCVPSRFANNMVPAIAGSAEVDYDKTDKTRFNNGSNPLPVAEINRKINSSDLKVDPDKIKKPLHPIAEKFLEQGLIADFVRGTTTSSARREVPSMVFGISTPGPLDKRINAKKSTVGTTQSPSPVTTAVSRLGGTQFVMDDGDERYLRKKPASEGPEEYADVAKGETGDPTIPISEYFRVRTRTGHQILMHNSEDLIYIANSRGTAWIELTSNGKIDIFAADSVSIHTETDLNIRADRDINLEAGRNINMRTESGRWHAEIATDLEFLVNANANITVGADYNLLVGADTKISSYKDFNLATNGSNNLTAGADTNISTTGNHVETAASINMNDTLTAAAADVATFVKPLDLRENLVVSTTAGWDKLYQAGKLTSIMKRIPMHEPWPQHENLAPDQQRPANTDRET